VLSETLAYITYKQKNDYHPIPLREEYVEKVSAFINSRYVDMIFATQEEASVAFDFVRCHPKIAASMADWISLILMVRQNIPVIQTYDRDFDVIKKEIPQFKDIIIWRR
jgi:hypothetical protein